MLSRTVITVLALLAGVLSATPAWASGWSSVDCAAVPSPSCDLGAGRDARRAPPAEPAPHRDGPSPRAGTSPRPAPAPRGDRIVGDDGAADCSYVRSNYQPPAAAVHTIAYVPPHPGLGGVRTVAWPPNPVLAPEQAPGRGGGWYVYRCTGQGGRDALYRAPVWLPDAPAQGAAPLPSPEEMAAQARAQLRLPSPVIASSPAGTQLVQLPTWLWVERGLWQPRSATASVPGVAVTATATPTTISWDTGDGSTTRCTGPGTPFTGGTSQAGSPDCGHTYHRSSAGRPDGRFPVTATVSWRITWSGTGAAGTFPDMTTRATTAFRVAEAQALGTG